MGRHLREPALQPDSWLASSLSLVPPPDQLLAGWAFVTAKTSEATPAGVRLPQERSEDSQAQIGGERHARQSGHFPAPAL